MHEERKVMPALRLPDDQKAQAVFNTLLGLDLHDRERNELLASGVAAHTVEELYPTSFFHVLTRLTGYLSENPNPVIYHGSQARWLAMKEQAAQDLHKHFSFRPMEERSKRWGEDNVRHRLSGEWRAFEEHLQSLQPRRHLEATRMIYSYTGTLYNAWWAMTNRELFGSRSWPKIDGVLVTAAWGMFPYLGAEVAS
jgi:hypothetical protein